MYVVWAWLACVWTAGAHWTDASWWTAGAHWLALSMLVGLRNTSQVSRLVTRLVTRMVTSSQGQRAWLAGHAKAAWHETLQASGSPGAMWLGHWNGGLGLDGYRVMQMASR